MGIAERKDREKAERRDLIQDAAMRVYHERGYHGTTMANIAREAELSRATLYHYFETKDDIFVRGIVSRSDYFGNLLEDLFECRRDVGERLIEELWRRFEIFYNRDPISFNATLYFHQSEMLRSLPEKLREMLDRSGTRNYGLLCRIMAYGVETGLLRECDPRTLAEVVWTSFLGVIHLENSKTAMNRKNHLEMTWNLAASILSRGLRSENGRNRTSNIK